MDEDTQAQMRRTPRQERGRQRVAQILDAAEALFGEAGYEAATTNQIAARAGVPIGSLYQFFPHKEALLHAVAARYRTAAADALGAALAPAAATLPAADLADLLLQTMVAFGQERIGLTKIVLQAGANEALGAAAAAIMQDAAAHLDALLALRHPALPAERRLLAARVALAAVMALLGMLTAEKARGHAHSTAILAETQLLLTGYLQALDRGASAGPPADDGTMEVVS
jgi:AcrR family transcriptional regulator